MLGFSFFISVFASFTWIFFSYSYISDRLIGVTIDSLGMVDLMTYLCLTLLPLLIIWLIFGYVVSYLNLKMNNKSFKALFDQTKKNQDYSDLIARALIECEQNIRSGFVLNRFDIFVTDLNELISEIISRCSIVSDSTLQEAWQKTTQGTKWFLGKVIIEAHRKNDDFANDIIEKSRKNPIIEGTILEFCGRYQSLISVLEKHDKEKILLQIIETGVFGKVFSIMAPIAEKLRHINAQYSTNTSLNSYEEDEVEFIVKEPKLAEKDELPTFIKEHTAPEEKITIEKKPVFSPKVAPSTEFDFEEEFKDLDDDIELSFTQKAMNSLSKEKEALRAHAEKISEKDRPFGNWIDDKNYN